MGQDTGAGHGPFGGTPAGSDPTAPIPGQGDHGQYGRYGQYGQYGEGSAPTAPIPGQGDYGRYGQYGEGSAPTAPIPGQDPGPGYGYGSGTAPSAAGGTGYGQFGAPQAPGQGSWVADGMAGARPGIVALRPLRVGEILEGAFRAVRHNPGPMFFYAGVTSLLTAALSFLTTTLTVGTSGILTVEEQTGAESLAQFGMVLVSAFTGLIATGAIVVSVSRSVIGERVTIGEVWQAVKGRLWALIGLSILVGLIFFAMAVVTFIVAGLLMIPLFGMSVGATGDMMSGLFAMVGIFLLVLLIAAIPALILFVRLVLSYPAVVLERAGPGRALSRSWSLTGGSTWRLVGLLVLTMIIATVVTVAVGVPVSVGAVGLGLDPMVAGLLTAAAEFLVNLVVTPFTAGVMSLAYIDQRMRKEGLDVQLARSVHGRA